MARRPVFSRAIRGLVPLIGIHLQHFAETQRDIADDLATTGAVNHVHSHHADHHHGGGRHDHSADDPADQCCMVHHHFAGVMPVTTAGSLHGYLIVLLLDRNRVPFGMTLSISPHWGFFDSGQSLPRVRKHVERDRLDLSGVQRVLECRHEAAAALGNRL